MSDFSVTTAAFSGFALIRGKPWLLLVWAAFLVAAIILTGVVFGAVAVGSSAHALASAGAGGQSDPSRIMSAIGPFMGLYILMYILFLLATVFVGAMLTTAVYRAVLRADDHGVGYLKIGADEFRQLWVTLAIGVPMMVVYFVVAVITTLIGGAIGLVAGQAVGALISVIGSTAAMAYFMVRFSLAGPQSFDERRVRLFESWSLTRGRFWPLLGAYLIPAAIVFGVITLVALILVAIAVGAVGAAGFQALSENPTEALGAALSLAGLFLFFYLIVYPLLMAFANAAVAAPPASAYKQLAHKGPEAVF